MCPVQVHTFKHMIYDLLIEDNRQKRMRMHTVHVYQSKPDSSPAMPALKRFVVN